MDLLARLEGALEGLVEGVFSRAFKAPLQPVEIAKRLTREMEQHRTVSINSTYVPNVYTIHLATETYQGFTGIRDQLLGELELYLREFAAEHQYLAAGAIAVLLTEDDSLKGNDFAVTIASDPQAMPSAPLTVFRSPSPATAQPAKVAAVLPAAHPVALEVMAGPDVGRRVPLMPQLTIGRGPENQLPLAAPGVSRHHAEIIYDGQNWVIHDLTSTNGTYVNHARIASHILRPGDEICIGEVVLKAN